MSFRCFGLVLCLFLPFAEQISAMCGGLLSYPNMKERTEWAKTLISRQENIYDDPDFYSLFAKADLDAVEALIKRWYGQEYMGMFGTILGFLDEKFVVLLLDPGIVNHSNDIALFGRQYKRKHPNCTPFELRKAFSDHLGHRTVYRGMVLTDAEASAIGRNGISAPGMFHPEYAVTPLLETFDPYIFSPQVHPRSPIDEILERHTDLGGKHGQWMSVSQFPQVAASLGYHESGRKNDSAQHLYVYEIDLPVLSVIEQKGLLARSFLQQEQFNLVIGDDFSVPLDNVGVEMFVPFHISPQSIKSVRRFQSPPPTYQRVPKR